jgi:hypothetical protein
MPTDMADGVDTVGGGKTSASGFWSPSVDWTEGCCYLEWAVILAIRWAMTPLVEFTTKVLGLRYEAMQPCSFGRRTSFLRPLSSRSNATAVQANANS